MTGVMGLTHDDPEVVEARSAAVSSPMVQDLICDLPSWGRDAVVSGHDSPAYLPNRVHLLADLGLRGGDDERVERALDALAAHQREDGRLAAFGKAPGHPEPQWGSLPCDTHAITEALIRFGRTEDPTTQRGLRRIAADLVATHQGLAWTCVPDPAVGFRGPGRKGDVCPQVTLEALRVFSRLPRDDRPDGLLDAAETMLAVWRDRSSRQPYMFGHGYRFKTVKWPPHWYGSYWMLDTLGRFPDLWSASRGDLSIRRRTAEMVACLIAYNVAPDGTVTPTSVYRGFERHSFGQKRRPSPTATALLARVVRRFSDLAPDVASLNVLDLASSRGGTGTPTPQTTVGALDVADEGPVRPGPPAASGWKYGDSRLRVGRFQEDGSDGRAW
jgi:hypothetical protein